MGWCSITAMRPAVNRWGNSTLVRLQPSPPKSILWILGYDGGQRRAVNPFPQGKQDGSNPSVSTSFAVNRLFCEYSSVGRASAFQAECRRFDPDYSLQRKSQGSRFLVSFAPLVDALSIIAPWLEPASWTTVLSPALRWPALTREIGRRPVKSSDKTSVVTPVILRGETRKYRRGNEFNLSVGKWYVVPFGTEFSGVRFTPLRPNYVSGYLVANKSVKSSNGVTPSPGTIPVMRLSRTAQTEELSHRRSRSCDSILQVLLWCGGY